MFKKSFYIFILILAFLVLQPIKAQESLVQELSGRILLQVEANGEAWYVNLADQMRYFLGRPADAFSLMRNLGIGITNNDLAKIPVGMIKEEAWLPIGSQASDSDNDGLADNLEDALGTDPGNPDSDNDSYDDKTEIENNYNPLGQGKLNIDLEFANPHLGKIFLQTEQNGEAWYLNPTDQKRYFLGRPSDAFAVMRNLSLGITNYDLAKIPINQIVTPTIPDDECGSQGCQSPQVNRQSAQAVFDAAGSAIRQGKTSEALSYFTDDMQKAIEYTMDFLDSEGRFTLENIMSGANLDSLTNEEKIFSTEIYFAMGGYSVLINFRVQKQSDGTWLLANL